VKLSPPQIEQYRADGYVLVPNVLTPREIALGARIVHVDGKDLA
jgi:hypothetical protein